MTGERIFSHTVSEDEAGERLDTLLAGLELVPSRAFAAKLIEREYVTVDGLPASKSDTAREGDFIEIELPLPEETDLIPEEVPLDIRFEDEHLIVLSKPAGMVVHPAHGHWSGTLVHALLAHTASLGSLQGEARPGIVHRLDKDTSGLMLVAKDDATQRALQDAIQQRLVDRRYLALAHGIVVPDTGFVDAPIGRAPKDRMKMAVSDASGSRQAVTSFRVLERFEADYEDDGYTLVECKLHTGRTHQVRVHLAYIRHPLVGDPLYGRKRRSAELGLERQFLHSYRLCFTHPITALPVDLIDPLPAELDSSLRGIAERSRGRTAAGEEVLEVLARSTRRT